MRFYISAPTWPKFLIGFIAWHSLWLVLGVLLAGVLRPSRACASTFSLFEVDRLDMEYYKYRNGYRNPYLITSGDDTTDGYRPMVLVDGSELNMNLSIAKYMYWRNRFHMASDQYKHVKYVGWEYEGGLDISSLTSSTIPVELFQHHHSQHGLEYVNPRGDKFPVEDTYGIRFIFINRMKEK